MPIFKYTAEDLNGRKKRGVIVGVNESEVANKLRRKELNPLLLVDITNTFEGKLNLFLSPIKTKDLVVFSRQFSVMISANVPVVESLLILVDQTDNIAFKNMLAEIAFEVDSGSFLSDSFAKRPKVFSDFFVNIVRSGESSGKLDEVLNYLADETEKNYDISSKIKGAMIYPIFIVIALIGVAIILMIYIIPSLTSTFTESGLDLPWATRAVMAVSNFLQKYIVVLAFAIVGFVLLLRLYAKTYGGRRNLDILKLKLPIFGKLFSYIYLMRFTRSLSTLLKGGVPITRSLSIVAEVVGNTIYRELILETLESINDGNPLSSVMENSSYVPNMVPQMIAVGEKTGKIDSVLDRITDFYERESSNMLDNLSKLMEPIIMVIMGIGVGIMVAAVLLPMYNMANAI
ncbi:type II secretion system F family protein [Candidatus Falkowbacteria bacterium]|jgi:type IV pilus assembly protein PilC|nr:type II secretion system F family protein [Candidatus Falkowbacteria bacterium]